MFNHLVYVWKLLKTNAGSVRMNSETAFDKSEVKFKIYFTDHTGAKIILGKRSITHFEMVATRPYVKEDFLFKMFHGEASRIEKVPYIGFTTSDKNQYNYFTFVMEHDHTLRRIFDVAKNYSLPIYGAALRSFVASEFIKGGQLVVLDKCGSVRSAEPGDETARYVGIATETIDKGGFVMIQFGGGGDAMFVPDTDIEKIHVRTSPKVEIIRERRKKAITITSLEDIREKLRRS
jgi:hypothetical protein